MLHQYKAIFFDAGGTLLYPYPSVGEIYERIASKYGCRAKSHEIQKRFLETWKELEGLSKLDSSAGELVTEKIERQW